MRPNSKRFADKLLSNPKISQTEAYISTHRTKNRNSARASASKLLANPNVAIYMEEHVKVARNRILSLVTDADKEEVQIRAAQDILDRYYGKASQRIEQTSSSVVINIDLSTDTGV